MARPAVILVGADKGGVGKTTVARTLIDYFGAHQTPTRAFDTESPRGTLKRFHPELTEVVDVTSVSDQMKIFDTLGSADAKVTIIDVRAGLLSSTLQALTEIGFLESAKKGQITFAVFHILGSSIASLEEIAEPAPSAMPITSWSRTSSTTRHSSNGIPPPTIRISKRSKVPRKSPSRSSMRWLTSRWKSPVFLLCRLSATKAPRATQPTIRLSCAVMSGTGLAMSGASLIA
jgi:hypothetical protein